MFSAFFFSVVFNILARLVYCTATRGSLTIVVASHSDTAPCDSCVSYIFSLASAQIYRNPSRKQIVSFQLGKSSVETHFALQLSGTHSKGLVDYLLQHCSIAAVVRHLLEISGTFKTIFMSL